METTGEGLTSLKFQFTRHGYSCNNAANIFSKEFEPSIHPFAIKQLDKAEKRKDGKHRFEGDDFDFETFNQPESQRKGIHVFVSPLIRTWETALLLFSQANPTATIINLYVGPYLKEHEPYGFKKGNYPENPRVIMKKFEHFININKVKELIRVGSTVMISGDEEDDENKNKHGSIAFINIFWPKDINTPPEKTIWLEPFNFEWDHGEFKFNVNKTILCEDNGIVPIKATNASIFFKGNLKEFMDKFDIFSKSYKREDKRDNVEPYIIDISGERIVHVVTHSHIMKEHLKDKYGVDMKKGKAYIKYDEGNNWSFTDTKDTMDTPGSLNLKIGVPEKHGTFDGIGNTCDIKKIDACLKPETKSLFSIPFFKGGKKTKKKRKPKRTHKKKNAHKKRKTHNKRKN